MINHWFRLKGARNPVFNGHRWVLLGLLDNKEFFGVAW